MDLSEPSWSMVKRLSSSSPGSSPAEQNYLSSDRRDRPASASEELRSPSATNLDTEENQPTEGRSLHSYVNSGHRISLSSSEDVTLFTDLDQGNKLIISSGKFKGSLVVDPSDMYQTLAMAGAQGPAGYDTSASSFMHSTTTSPVYVPTTRVGPMISGIPYLQGSGASQPSHAVSNHSVWSQPASESPSYSTGSPHASNRFHYSPSPPVNNGASRDGNYSNTLNVNGRDQYSPLARPLNGSYPSPYSPYVGSQLTTAWPTGPFDNTMLHTLQNRGAPIPIRAPNGGSSNPVPMTPTSSSSSNSEDCTKTGSPSAQVPVSGINSSAMSGQGDSTNAGSTALNYSGQEGLYTGVNLTSTAEVATSVRGEMWCGLALA
ncbi:UNVERIFIED_CONTAM: hypothetical protein FKN15_023732 [Acipenser sinensis]